MKGRLVRLNNSFLNSCVWIYYAGCNPMPLWTILEWRQGRGRASAMDGQEGTRDAPHLLIYASLCASGDSHERQARECDKAGGARPRDTLVPIYWLQGVSLNLIVWKLHVRDKPLFCPPFFYWVLRTRDLRHREPGAQPQFESSLHALGHNYHLQLSKRTLLGFGGLKWALRLKYWHACLWLACLPP